MKEQNINPNICIWTKDEEEIWWTSCDNAHQFFDGGPRVNKYKFCPYCGKKLQEGIN
jgi:hypothetical protein